MNFLTLLGSKLYLVLPVLAVIGLYFYQSNKIESLEKQNTNQQKLIKEKEDILEKTIEAYEYSLKIQAELSKVEAITTNEKEKVIAKQKTLIKAVEKRGEIKNENNFTIVEF